MMGLLNFIINRQIKGFVKGGYKANKNAYEAMEKARANGDHKLKTSADCIAEAIRMRSVKWKPKGQRKFACTTGGELEIKENDSIEEVILSILVIEARDFLPGCGDPMESFDLFIDELKKISPLSHEEIDAKILGNIIRKS